MKVIKSFLTVVVIVLVGVSCSKGDRNKSRKKKKVKDVPPIVQLDVVPENPVSGKDIEVFTVLTEQAKKKNLSFLVEWKVNGDIIKNGEEYILFREKFVKGDTVQCTVMASLNGRHLQTIKTKKIRVGNSPPEIHPKLPDNFEIPGTFYYKIKASDPDDDALTYTLLSPLDRGIRLNGATGEIEWYISPQLLDRLERDAGIDPNDGRDEDLKSLDPSRRSLRNVKIEFQVTDSDNASDTGFIMLNMDSGRESNPI